MSALPTPNFVVTRRNVLKGSGALIVSLALPGFSSSGTATAAQLDTYLAIAEDGSVTAFFGKVDMGQGVGIAQIVAEELDVPFERVRVVMGDSALTVDQGGGSGSTALERGSRPLRSAAAEARRILLELGAKKLQTPVAALAVTAGFVHLANDSSQRVSYGELIGGRHFGVTLQWNGSLCNALDAKGLAQPKRPDQYTLVGKPMPRPEIADVVFGTKQYLVDVSVPGMMHGRVLRPPVAGAVPLSVNETSIRDIRGARAVQRGDFLAVVAETEWDAIRAANTLKVKWSQPPPAFPRMEDLYDHIRQAPVVKESSGSGYGAALPVDTAPVDAALARATRVIEAEYLFPYQSHASMAPACAVADCRDDSATVWTGSQKPHTTAQGVARLLKLPLENVRAIWISGPGSYGRNDAGDAAMDAALLSKAVGRPVRVQGMRHEGPAWDPKAPASIHVARAGFDADGNVVAYSFRSKGFSAGEVAPSKMNPSDTHAGQVNGWPNAIVHRFGNPEGRYEFPAKLEYWQTVAPFLERASPLRTAHFRDPLGPQLHFASESFLDEMAAAFSADPVEFRLRYLKEARDAAVLKAVAQRAGWVARPSGPNEKKTSGIAAGRGVAYTRRGSTVVAIVADVEVDLQSGRVRPRKFTVASDQGQVINPLGLRRTIEGNVIMAASRALHEEVTFVPERVTRVDWASYPILDMADAPYDIDIVLLNHDDMPPYGAGEPSTRTVVPAIANAIYDATGVRVRQVPFTPQRIKAALDKLA